MPFSLLVKSAVMPGHFWEVQRSMLSRGTSSDGYNYVENGGKGTYENDTWTVNTDNALPVPSIVEQNTFSDYLFDGTTSTQTSHAEPAGTGETVAIMFPTYQTEWGSLTSVQYLITGDLTVDMIVMNQANMTLTSAQGLFPRTSSGFAAIAQPVSPPAGQDFYAPESWLAYRCGSTVLINGREPFVARQRFLVCDSGYGNYTFDFVNVSERFHFLSDQERAVSGPGFGGEWTGFTGSLSAWANSASGATRSLYLQVQPYPWGAVVNGPQRTFVAPGTFVERTFAYKVRYSVSNLQLILSLNWNGTNSPQGAYGQIGLDCFDDIIAAAWMTAPSGGKKQLLIGTQRSLEKNIGSGSGNTGGWDVYNFGDVDERSPIGFEFLPNGWLFLSYNTYDGSGNATAYYVINKQHGLGPVTNWTAPAALTPNVAQTLGIGRSMGQAFRTRVA